MKFTFPPESRPLDGYTIKRAIDRGGFGEVYYALSDGGKEVALKLLNENLEVELRGVSQCLNLKHPNLVTIFDVRTDADGDHWIVMEYIHGQSLDDVLERHDGSMPSKEIKQWLSGVAAGLGFLHDRGIVHRDLKPANIYLESGVVKIGDVGLAKFISESKRSAQTQSVGTVYYMAPEVAHGRYGREVDIYSLGVILYEMLTGRVPFDGESTGEILMKHLSEEPDLTPVPEPFRPVLAQALQKDPHRRTPTVAQLEADFSKAATECGQLAPRVDSPLAERADHTVSALQLGTEVPQEIPADSFRRNSSSSRPDSDAGPEQDVRGYVDRVRMQVAEDVRLAVAQGKQAVKQAKQAAREEYKRYKKAAKYRHKMRNKVNGRVAEAGPAGSPGLGDTGARCALPPPPQRTPVRSDREPAATAHRRTGQSIGPAHADKLHKWFMVAAVVIVVLALVAPRALPGLVSRAFLAGIYLALAYGVYRLILYFSQPSRSLAPQPHLGEPSVTPPRSSAPAQAANPAARPISRPTPRPRHEVHLGPETRRAICLRQRMTELTGSFTLAVLTAAVLTVGLATLTAFLPDAARIALFGVTTLLGAWTVLGFSKTCEGTSLSGPKRRFLLLLLGCVVGAAAYGLDQSLMIDFQLQDHFEHPEPLLVHVGDYRLLDGYQPTLIGYVVFFAGLFGLRRWWRHADGFRKKRFRLLSVLLTVVLGWICSLVVGFPILWGVTWAAAISSVVHLSAPWVPTEQRRRLMEGTTDVA